MLTLLFFINPLFLDAQNFDRFFQNTTLRVDYYHTGTKGQEIISIDKAILEGVWPGSKKNLIDTLNLGDYLLKVYDAATNSLIYSRGYSTMFNEWQTTDEANAGIMKTFHETMRFPFPNRKIQISISRRDKQMLFHEIFYSTIDPASPTDIHREKPAYKYPAIPIMYNGDSENKVDLLILGDGYTKNELKKFRSDVDHFLLVFFSTSPFKERKSDFNVWMIETPSEESGIDKPDKNIWKNNIFGTAYNSFGSARYILTEENRTLRDIAAAAPYDFIHILVNDNRYGGGGIFNLYATCYANPDTVGQEWQRDYVFVHEFGHSFAGLGDEYYSSQVAYNDFYAKGVEPWEPNLTALLDPKNLKWKNLVDPAFTLPTPWNKSAYDSIETVLGKLDRLAPDYYQKRDPLKKTADEIIHNPALAGKVGAFEGAGYVSEGLYRPSIDCRMFSLNVVPFDPVCAAAIVRMIDMYSR